MPDPIYVLPGDAKSFSVKYIDGGNAAKKAQLESQWKHFNRFDPATNTTYYIWYRSSSPQGEVMVDYRMPATAPTGVYRIETFVPGKNATTRQAIFTIANNYRTVNNLPQYDDSVAAVDMYHTYDQWVSLGQYVLDPKVHPFSGRVRQYVLSIENPATSVSFGPLRWVPLSVIEEEVVQPAAAHFDPPVGSDAERAGPLSDLYKSGFGPMWVGNWYDANPFLAWYWLGYHTGADLNLTTSREADANAPIYAVGDGKVIFAGAAGSWGNLIVIEHPDALVTLPGGQTRRQIVFSRYGHTSSDIRVAVNQTVTRGQLIGFIGLAPDQHNNWHLHFDIAYNEQFRTMQTHWPNMDKVKQLEAAGKTNTTEYSNAQVQVKQEVLRFYVDPYRFLKDNR